jgi:hypothetical protein
MMKENVNKTVGEIRKAVCIACHRAGLTCFLPMFIERLIRKLIPEFFLYLFGVDFLLLARLSGLKSSLYFSAFNAESLSARRDSCSFAQETETKNKNNRNNAPMPFKLSIIAALPYVR